MRNTTRFLVPLTVAPESELVATQVTDQLLRLPLQHDGDLGLVAPSHHGLHCAEHAKVYFCPMVTVSTPSMPTLEIPPEAGQGRLGDVELRDGLLHPAPQGLREDGVGVGAQREAVPGGDLQDLLAARDGPLVVAGRRAAGHAAEDGHDSLGHVGRPDDPDVGRPGWEDWGNGFG
ncbi:hypothetical protein EYF80_046494 [Liparis tanakae]|uniref:Uncharacterized protein n=1 Tax=Liparis tanakae TaxID=230148 RepID=A0A4Z2FQ81_9TELE|nr:hypothetical protein EYF80_046494 [Liparis tanakae]